jgi:hypothetical protein
MDTTAWMDSVEDIKKQKDDLLLVVSDLRITNQRLGSELEVLLI